MERKHYLDQLRAFLMFLGIPYHAGMIYSANIDWIVSSAETSVILTWVFQFTHTFRMPAFMIISGFFAMLMIGKQGESVWLKSRFIRLGVPLISVALLVNPWQMLAGAIAGHGLPNALQADVWHDWLARLSSPGGHWIEQLWFLGDLLIYSSVLALGWRYGGRLRLGRVSCTLLDLIGRDWKNAVLALILMGAGVVGAATIGSMLDVNILFAGMVQTVRTVAFAPFFALGAALAYRPDWLERFTTIHLPSWCAAAAACLILTLVEPREEPVCKAASYFLTPIAGILSAHVLLCGARRWFNRSTALTRRMVEASMVVYLFHMMFVCWFGLAFTYVEWPVLAEFGIIVVAATAASFGVHAVVSRSGTLRFLFNGTTRGDRLGGPSLTPRFQGGR
jgi:glucan biosynthesis protein C